MIYFLTVHYGGTRWLDIQLRQINIHTNAPYKVIAFVDEYPSSTDFGENIYFISDQGIVDHATKLNLLADIVVTTAEDNDLLVFIDSDCFPIASWLHPLSKVIASHHFAAIQRAENNQDIQPHPSFAVFPVSVWRQFAFDWSAGYAWYGSDNYPHTDVGANILKLTLECQLKWYPLLRSNIYNMHPLFFGVYHNIVYHHGAGSRRPFSRLERAQMNSSFPWFARGPIRSYLAHRYINKTIRKNLLSSEVIFSEIALNPLYINSTFIS